MPGRVQRQLYIVYGLHPCMRVTKGCPLCRGDVFGTFETGFYCKACNLMYRKRHVLFSEVRDETRVLITKHFSGFGPKDRREVVETEQFETAIDVPEKHGQKPEQEKTAKASQGPATRASRARTTEKKATLKKPAPRSKKPKPATKRAEPGKKTHPAKREKATRKRRSAKLATAPHPSLEDHPATALLEAAASPARPAAPAASAKRKKKGKENGGKPGLEDLL